MKSYEPKELERVRQRINDLESELELVKGQDHPPVRGLAEAERRIPVGKRIVWHSPVGVSSPFPVARYELRGNCSRVALTPQP